MPPKKKAKKTQTVSLDKRTQAKMLRDKASAFEAEATVEERIHELLEPATVSANTFLLKVFHKKASAEVMLSHKKKAYLDAGFAIKECEHEIWSGEHAMELKGVGKSSASLIDKAMEEREKVSKSFFNIVESKGVRKAYASLPKDAEITLDTDGVLRVNGRCRENYHARGCPYETEIDSVKYIVDGVADYDGFSNACAGLKFDGTITKNTKKQKEVYRFHFEYRHVYESIDKLRWWYDSEDEVDYDDGELNEMAMDNIVSNYEFGFIE